MRPSILWVSCSALMLSCDQSPTQNQAAAMLKKAPAIAKPPSIAKGPSIHGKSYKCGEMIELVNHLRQLGKDKCLAALREYLETESPDQSRVLLICRLLFVNPNGWAPPLLGAPFPEVKEKVAKQFPLFPIALSDRVPFLVIQGYMLGGRGEFAFKCVELCQNFELIAEDYPLSGYEKAAHALTEMESFRDLYKDEDDLPRMVEMVLRQAKPEAEPGAPRP